MAFESKTELKARVSANKLEADLLNNMIDSMVSLESDGSLVVDGDVQADSVTTAALTATTADIDGGTIDGATISGGTIDATAIDGGAIPSLVATTADINGGTIDGATIGASLASSIKATTIETTGNASIGVSPEPWDVGFNAIDVGPNISVFSELTGTEGISKNSYRHSSGWRFRNATGFAYLERTVDSTGIFQVFVSSTTSTGADGPITWVLIYERDQYGNTAEGGATLTGKTLDSTNHHYAFNGTSCIMTNKISGAIFNCCNIYFGGSVWLSIANTGDYSAYSGTYPTAFIIRQSTAIATSANQSLTMTTVITPS